MNTIQVLSLVLFAGSRVLAFHGLNTGVRILTATSNINSRFAVQSSQSLDEPQLDVYEKANISPIQFNPDEQSPTDDAIALNPPKIRKGAAPEFAIAGDSTVETPSQVAAVVTHFGLTFLNLALAASAIPVHSAVDVVPIALTIALSIVVGDFGTGVFHWATDNYGSIKTPVFGSVCAAFQGHHVTPWTITFRSFANNVYKICYGTVPALLIVAAVPMEPLVKVFFTLFITWWMISQELHKFSHMRSTPKAIKVFQDMGIILSKKEHGLHHTAPFEGHYCILTGVCNSFLDDSKFFRHLENIVYKLTGTSITCVVSIARHFTGNFFRYQRFHHR